VCTELGKRGEDNIKIIITVIIILVIAIFLYSQNNHIKLTYIDVDLDRLPEEFHGYTVVHISDLHNKSFGENQVRLIDKIERVNPDLIVSTGDLIDSRRQGMKNSIEFISRAVDIAPVYYVTGNHEWRSGLFDSLREVLIEKGVNVLQNAHDIIERGEDKIYIIGIDDPVSDHRRELYREDGTMSERIQQSMDGIPEESFKILLSHRPEKLPIYSESGIDLSFTGHAHGGQVRLPFIGGLIAPNQGLFPKYTAGEYEYNGSIMVVSRGLGNSIVPQRLFNRPETVVVTFKNKNL